MTHSGVRGGMTTGQGDVEDILAAPARPSVDGGPGAGGVVSRLPARAGADGDDYMFAAPRHAAVVFYGISGTAALPEEDHPGFLVAARGKEPAMDEDKTAMSAGEHVITFSDGGDEAFGGGKLAGNVLRRGLGVAGIVAASLAVTGLAAGGAASAAAGFGLFTALLCGVSLVTLRVLDA